MKKGMAMLEVLLILVVLAIISITIINTFFKENEVDPDIKEEFENQTETDIEDTGIVPGATLAADKIQIDIILDAANMYYTSNLLSGTKFIETENIYDKISFSGSKPEDVVLKINNSGQVFINAYLNSYCFVKNFSSNDVTYSETTKEDCITN